MKDKLPAPVIIVVSEVIGSFYYSHRRLNLLFAEKGAPGEPPEGNCVEKCSGWLKRADADADVDAFLLLGGVLEEYMEVEPFSESTPGLHEKGRVLIRETLARFGLSYQAGGRIVGAKTATPTRTLEASLRARSLDVLDVEIRRALENVEKDPAATLTAACSLLESLFKVYIEDEGLVMPNDKSISPLWKVAKEGLGFDPKALEDDDLKQVLQGMASIVNGIGSARTHAGSAHGRGRRMYSVEPRHARLAAHAAHTLALFILETWDARKQKAAAGK